ncbi:winged helix repair factor 1-like [Glandiceps talaboti]
MKRSRRIPDVFKKKRKIMVGAAGQSADWGNQDSSSVMSQQELVSDTKAALIYVKSQYHIETFDSRIPPIVLKHQIYGVVHNKTLADRQLDDMKEKKEIKMFKLGLAVDEYCIVFTEDYKKHVMRHMAGNKVVERFLDTAIDKCCDVSLSKATMIDEFEFTDEEITLLVNASVLTVRDIGSWWLAIPGAGIFMKTFVKGRQALLRAIRKAKYQEILQQDLEGRKLTAVSKLGMSYHMMDIIGAEFVTRIQTTSGWLLRLKE